MSALSTATPEQRASPTGRVFFAWRQPSPSFERHGAIQREDPTGDPVPPLKRAEIAFLLSNSRTRALVILKEFIDSCFVLVAREVQSESASIRMRPLNASRPKSKETIALSDCELLTSPMIGVERDLAKARLG
jgi:hypothetical protein